MGDSHIGATAGDQDPGDPERGIPRSRSPAGAHSGLFPRGREGPESLVVARCQAASKVYIHLAGGALRAFCLLLLPRSLSSVASQHVRTVRACSNGVVTHLSAPLETMDVSWVSRQNS